MRTNHLCQRLYLRHTQGPFACAILREKRADVRHETVERKCELPDLIPACNIHLYGEIISAAHTAHRRRQRMHRPPQMAAQPIGEIRRQTKCNSIHREHEPEEIVKRRRIEPLAQMHGKSGVRRCIGKIPKDGRNRLPLRL